MTSKKVLLIEDEKGLHQTIIKFLSPRGYKAFSAYEGKTGIEIALLKKPDLILLDLGLPGMDGTDVCRMLKSNPKTVHIPIVIITARAGHNDELEGLNIGADDYITKPLRMEILEARIKKRLKDNVQSMHQQTSQPQIIEFSDITLDQIKKTISTDGECLELTHTEYLILEELIKMKGDIAKYEVFSNKKGGSAQEMNPGKLHYHTANIRRKIKPKGWDIKVHYKEGYSLSRS